MPKAYKLSKRGKGIAHQQRHKHFLNEQRRKQRKLIKKGAITPSRSKLSKDPSIPNIYPYKKAIMQKILQENETLTREQFQRQIAQHLNDEFIQQIQSNSLVQPHLIQQNDTNEEENYVQERHMRKQAFKQDLLKTVEQADVLLEVLDARDPENTRNAEIEQLAVQKGKPFVLILNKIDLVPQEVLRAWLEFYKRLNVPTLLFKCPQNITKGSVRYANAQTGLSDRGACVGAAELKHLISKLLPGAKKVVAACFGYPNTGKSSVINALANRPACAAAPVPGQTRKVQEVHIDTKLRILDSPGVIYDTKNSVILREEMLEDPIAEVSRLFSMVKDQAAVFIGYDLSTDIENDGKAENGGPSVECVVRQFLYRLGKKHGRIGKGGIVDQEQVAIEVIRDWNRGKIPFWREPGDFAHVAALQAGHGGVDVALLQQFNADVLGHIMFQGNGVVLK